jgi:hypothetical protein
MLIRRTRTLNAAIVSAALHAQDHPENRRAGAGAIAAARAAASAVTAR